MLWGVCKLLHRDKIAYSGWRLLDLSLTSRGNWQSLFLIGCSIEDNSCSAAKEVACQAIGSGRSLSSSKYPLWYVERAHREVLSCLVSGCPCHSAILWVHEKGSGHAKMGNSYDIDDSHSRPSHRSQIGEEKVNLYSVRQPLSSHWSFSQNLQPILLWDSLLYCNLTSWINSIWLASLLVTPLISKTMHIDWKLKTHAKARNISNEIRPERNWDRAEKNYVTFLERFVFLWHALLLWK